MSFFGLENNDLEDEKRRFMSGDLHQEEDIAVYNWGSEDYGGLGNALVEGEDDFNDETFGGTGPVGKDFDFTAQTLSKPQSLSGISQVQVEQPIQNFEPPKLKEVGRQSSKDSIWENKSPFSVLPRANASLGRKSGLGYGQVSTSPSVLQETRQSPSLSQQGQPPTTTNYATTGIRTLQEIEAEMVAKTQRARAQAQLQAQAKAQALAQAQAQAQLQAQAEARVHAQTQAQLLAQQQHMRPPRMRSQSPSTFSRLRPQSGGRSHSPIVAYQQQHLLEQQDQMRIEELERQLREQNMFPDQNDILLDLQRQQQQQQQQQQALLAHTRQQQLQDLNSADLHQIMSKPFGPSAEEIQAMLDRRQSPLLRVTPQQLYSQQAGLNAPNNNLHPREARVQQLQLQQRLLAQLAQAEFAAQAQDQSNGGLRNHQEALRAEAMRKIMETERLEIKRRRKAAKLAHMSRYNDLMTQSDKDFITRIQVSQLVTSDPYTEDFYAQVYGSLLRSRMGLDSQGKGVLDFGSAGGVGLGVNQKPSGRRQNAMQRMEAQVERIVNNARQREKEKGLHAIHSLQGALGKTAGRSYKAAPRQLLQVDSGNTSDASAPHTHGHISKEDNKENAAGGAKEAAKIGREALGDQSDSAGVIQRDPLTRRQSLIILEGLYDTLLKVEQLRRAQPNQMEEQRLNEWEESYSNEVQNLWDGLQIMVPLETSDPHPFISLLKPSKGKRLLPRLTRHFSSQQLLTVLTLLVACFQQLDVVVDAPVLDTALELSEKAEEVEKQTHVFLSTVLQSILPVIGKASLRLVGGLLGLLMERCALTTVALSRPGLSLLTAFLSRVEVIKSDVMAGTIAPEDQPSDNDLLSWQNVYDHLFEILSPHLLTLFPSYRILHSNFGGAPVPPVAPVSFDVLDQPVWQFLATVSLQANNEQQQHIVASLRELILNNVMAVNRGNVADTEEAQLKLDNVNVLLHALGLDSQQIPV